MMLPPLIICERGVGIGWRSKASPTESTSGSNKAPRRTSFCGRFATRRGYAFLGEVSTSGNWSIPTFYSTCGAREGKR
jgi:hypothetical protein